MIKFFKILFWLSYVFFLISMLIQEFRYSAWSFIIITDGLISILVIVGILIYAFRIRLLTIEWWKLFLFVYLTWSVYKNIIIEVAKSEIKHGFSIFPITNIFTYVFMLIPSYYALYKLSFSKKSPFHYDKEE